MQLKLFFVDYCEDKVIESKDARVASKEEILHSMDCVLHMPRNFIGVTDENDVTLQFMVNEDRTICVDVPAPAEKGSYVKTTDLRECLDIVRGLGQTINAKEIDGIEDEIRTRFPEAGYIELEPSSLTNTTLKALQFQSSSI